MKKILILALMAMILVLGACSKDKEEGVLYSFIHSAKYLSIGIELKY